MAGSSLIQVIDDFLGSESHALRATLPVSRNSVSALSDDVAVPPRPLGTRRGSLFQYGRELERLTLSGEFYVISHALSLLL